ncbi:MAG: ferredoxin [Gemmatimonadetes bacterium]|nr:ferredoxin [Gemmatimonadota bacterium]
MGDAGGTHPTAPDPTSEREVHGVRVVIDRDLCVGFGDCIAEAPDAFELDEDGVAILTNPEEASKSRLLDACATCPVDAITVYEDGVAIIP